MRIARIPGARGLVMRQQYYIASMICVFLLSIDGLGQIRVTDSVLDSPVNPVRLVDVQLTTALSGLGYNLKDGSYIVFGTVVLLDDSCEEPHVTLNLLPGDTVRTAVESLAQQLSEYQWILVSQHLMNVFPTQQKGIDLLTTRVGQFDIKNEYPVNILGAPAQFIPELHQAVLSEPTPNPRGNGVGYGTSYATGEGPQISLSFRNVTVREILNGIVDEMTKSFPANHPPVGWLYRITVQPAPSGRRIHSWTFHRSVPELNWKTVVAAREGNSLRR